VLRAADLYLVRLPLVQPFAAAHGTLVNKDALLIRAETDDGYGWGECAVLAEPTYEAHTIETCRSALQANLLGPLPAPAQAALECAVLDARLRREGTPLAVHLDATRAFVTAGVAVGLDADVAPYVDAGYRRIKCKIVPGRGFEIAQAARKQAPGIELAVDANGSYDGMCDEMYGLDSLGLQCIEQPFAADSLREHVTLHHRIKTRICLDESITSVERALEAWAMHAYDIASIKPGRLGGIARAKELIDRGLPPTLMGGMLETGVGRAVLVALAAADRFGIPGDIAASDRYFEHDITEPFVLEHGQLRVPTEPGLGRTPLPDMLERYTIEHERITP
jgi:O-succinylbenzoate synthase